MPTWERIWLEATMVLVVVAGVVMATSERGVPDGSVFAVIGVMIVVFGVWGVWRWAICGVVRIEGTGSPFSDRRARGISSVPRSHMSTSSRAPAHSTDGWCRSSTAGPGARSGSPSSPRRRGATRAIPMRALPCERADR